jgi:hypothetical protein
MHGSHQGSPTSGALGSSWIGSEIARREATLESAPAGHPIPTLLIMQNYSEKRVVDLDFAVVLDEAQFPELVHEHIHPRAGCSDHFR